MGRHPRCSATPASTGTGWPTMPTGARSCTTTGTCGPRSTPRARTTTVPRCGTGPSTPAHGGFDRLAGQPGRGTHDQVGRRAGAEGLGPQVIEHRPVALHLVLVFQEEAAGEVLQVHHRGVRGVGELQHGERAGRLR